MADEKQGSGTGAGPTEGTPMAMGMAMCSEMLNTIRQTNALAVFTTPELQHIVAEWLKGLEVKAEGPGAPQAELEQARAELARARRPWLRRLLVI